MNADACKSGHRCFTPPARRHRDTTALVHECFLKFMQRDGLGAADLAHFLACQASVMRWIVVDAL